ncbi:uncharacterized protein G2W53_020069 [Senna tora]|uniref:Uncharacterized protein n=1 Tax=Senna tora TaxID=362788 RepID=A0A834WMJ5_9FABA|nr:uncharacterized protein G2W53_020069 [Senna tora]
MGEHVKMRTGIGGSVIQIMKIIIELDRTRKTTWPKNKETKIKYC